MVAKFKNHIYAYGTQIDVAITPDNESSAIPELQKCLRSVQGWIAASKLKLNPDKTEFIIFSSPAQQGSLSNM